jgi:hypothetical protein
MTAWTIFRQPGITWPVGTYISPAANEGGLQMKVYTQKEGIYICGKIKEVRLLLLNYSGRFRTVKELIREIVN